MPGSAGAGDRGSRFRASGRACQADRAARRYHRIDRIRHQTVAQGGAQAPRAIAMLRFADPCTKDGAEFAALSPRQCPLDFRGPPMSGFSTARQKMVDGQVRPSDVTDIRIIDAMLAVPREAFVPAESARAGLSRPRSRCQRRGCRQALSDQARGDRENAAGGRDQARPTKSWWSAAPPDMRRPWRPSWPAKVTATESDPSLAAKAKDILAEIGLGNVTVKAAAAADGDPAERAL